MVKCFAGTVRVNGVVAGSPARASRLLQAIPLDYANIRLGERVVQVKDLPDGFLVIKVCARTARTCL